MPFLQCMKHGSRTWTGVHVATVLVNYFLFDITNREKAEQPVQAMKNTKNVTGGFFFSTCTGDPVKNINYKRASRGPIKKDEAQRCKTKVY